MVLFIAIFFVGCGKGDLVDVGAESSQGVRYEATYTDISTNCPTDTDFESGKIYGNRVAILSRTVAQSENSFLIEDDIIIYSLETGKRVAIANVRDILAKNDNSIQPEDLAICEAFGALGENRLLISIRHTDSENHQRLFLAGLDENGANVLFMEITDSFDEIISDVHIVDVAGTSDAMEYILTDKNIICVNSAKDRLDTKVIESADLPQKMFELGNEVYGYSEETRKLCSVSSKGIKSVLNNPEVVIKDLIISDTGIYYISTDEGVYSVDRDFRDLTLVYKWDNIDAISSGTIKLVTTENGDFLAYFGSNIIGLSEIADIQICDTHQDKQRQEIIFVTGDSLNESIIKVVKRYNRSQNDYTVKVVCCSEPDDGLRAQRLLAGTEYADLIMLDYFDSYQQYASSGIFEDLYPYIDSDPRLSREDYSKEMLDSYTYDDKLVSIPYTFLLKTIVARNDEIGNTGGFSIHDMEKEYRLYSENDYIPYGRAFTMRLMLALNATHYYDTESGMCDFDNDEFKSILELLKNIPETGPSFQDPEDQAKAFNNGCLAYAYVPISSIYELQTYLYQFHDATLVGYPNDMGIYAYQCDSSISEKIAISALSKHKEGAWDFLAYYLSSEYPDDVLYWTFPSRLSEIDRALEIQNEKVKEMSLYNDNFNAESVKYHEATSGEIAMIRQMIDNIETDDLTTELFSIIYEEASPYWAGDKTMDEVIKVIQSRASLMMAE
jgi:ABC-type glycerol-3-phosphate transport system substrate-binding protein